jgi:hypothetical protein
MEADEDEWADLVLSPVARRADDRPAFRAALVSPAAAAAANPQHAPSVLLQRGSSRMEMAACMPSEPSTRATLAVSSLQRPPASHPLAARVMEVVARLNPEQQQAVQVDRRFSLVLAGPGSGKTHVLTTRLDGFPPGKKIALLLPVHQQNRLHHTGWRG